MRIGFDAKFLRGKPSGNGVFSEAMLRALAEVDEENEYIVYMLNQRRPVDQANFSLKRMSPLHRFPQMRQLVTFPLELRRHPVDLFHGIYTLPYYTPGKMVLSLIEFFWITHPEEFPMSRLATRQRIMATGYAIQRADRIITPTHFVRTLLQERYRIPDDRVATIGLAYDPFFLENPGPDILDRVLAKFGVTAPYVLSVGNLHPRKNFSNLLEACRILRDTKNLGHMLVITGDFYTRYEPMLKMAQEGSLRGRVVFPGYVTREELRALYWGADIFVFPSLHEGFGLPLLEAMATRTPLAVSRASSIPEVAGDAAVLFDPKDPSSMADTIWSLLDSPSLKETLVQRGTERLRLFSWKEAARRTLEVYHSM